MERTPPLVKVTDEGSIKRVHQKPTHQRPLTPFEARYPPEPPRPVQVACIFEAHRRSPPLHLLATSFILRCWELEGLMARSGTLRLARGLPITRRRSVAEVPEDLPPGHASKGKLHLEERGSIPRRAEQAAYDGLGQSVPWLALRVLTPRAGCWILPWSSCVVIYRDQTRCSAGTR